MIHVLFVCLGNICRSPVGEGVFKHLVAQAGLTDHIKVDSAGTGAWHIGEGPDERAVANGRQNGVLIAGQARQVRPADFETFDYVLAMDQSNYENLLPVQARAKNPKAQLALMRQYDPEGSGSVPDPYFGGPEGFQTVFNMVYRSAEQLLQHIIDTHQLTAK